MRGWMMMLVPAALFAAAPAGAQTAYPDWAAGPWEVYGDGSDCWIVYHPDAANQLSIAVARTDTDFYIGLKMPASAGVVPKQSYPAVVKLGGQSYDTIGFGMSKGDSLGTILDTPSPQMMGVLRRADRLTYTARGGSFEVKFPAEAKRQFLACEVSIGGAGSAPED